MAPERRAIVSGGVSQGRSQLSLGVSIVLPPKGHSWGNVPTCPRSRQFQVLRFVELDC